jgi:MATE family multidrug resistance protein
MSKSFRQHIRETITLAIPVAIGQLGHVMLGVTDSLMVGHLGPIPLAAASLGNSIFILLLVFAVGICSAITPLTAIACGEENHEEAGVVFRQGLLLNVVIGVVLIVTTLLVSNTLGYLNQPPDVAAQAEPYLRIMGFSFVPMMIFISFRNFIEGLSFTRPAMVIILVANAVNVAGNWVFIHGKLGMPALGLNGAGYSSLVVEVFSAIAILAYVLRSSRFTRYQPLLEFRSFNVAMQKKLLRIGLPSAMQYVFEAGSFSFSAIMMGWIGSTALAAHQIAISLASVSFMISLGISNAATIRVGHAVGRKDRVEVRRAGFSAVLLAIGLMSTAAVSFILFRDYFPTLYIDNSEVISLASTLLIFGALFQLSDGIQVVGHGILRGMTDVTVPMFIAVFAYWVIGLPSGYVFGFVLDMGAQGIWLGFVAGLSTAAFAFLIRFHRHSKGLFFS